MKKHITIIAIALLVFSSLATSAQPNAGDIVKSIAKSFRDKKNAEIVFDYHYEYNATNHSDVQQGLAYLQGESYKVILNEQQTISDGETIWTYLIDDEEVVVSSTSFGDDNTPLKMLTSLDKYYSATFADPATIVLSNPEGQFQLINLIIDPKKNTMKGLEFISADGSKMVIAIKETKFEQDLKDDFFTFDEKAHPEVDIIDMR